jgi:hypothetical protein
MYQPKYNKQAKEWDVVDKEGKIVAMFGGGKKGEEDAKRFSENNNK